MSKGYPQYTSTARKGERGVDAVSRIVNEHFKWLFRRHHQEHDFGIDGQIDVITSEGLVTGQMLAVQIKYGKSFVSEQNRWGYVYRGELKHFNYLANYPLPVLIVICDPNTEECYWTAFDKTQAEVTASGWKLTVSRENILKDSKSELEALLQPTEDSLSALEDYWTLNRLMVQSSGIHFVIDRTDVEAMDTSEPRVFFDRLCSTKEFAFHCQGKVEISFHGYETDQRELFQVPEMRSYTRALSDALPELLFFVRTQEPTYALKTIVLCQTHTTVVRLGSVSKKTPHKIEFTTKEVGEFFLRLWPGLNRMTEWLEMTIEENKRISFAAIKAAGLTPPDDV